MTFPTALYKQPRLLDRKADMGKRVRPVTDFRMTAGMNAMMITAVEFFDAAREFVIAFITPEAVGVEGKPAAAVPAVSPVVILGIRENENLMVRADGTWDARYLPAFVRRYPFAYIHDDQGRMNLIVDAGWPGFNDQEGELLVQPDGEPTPFLQEMMQYLDKFEQEVQRTHRFCQELVALDLLITRRLDGKLPESMGGQSFTVGGFSVIDEAKLRALPDAKVLELHRNGMLTLIHAQLMSMGNAPRLMERLVPRMAAAAGASAGIGPAPQPR